jgi:small neutral amino acid transporter SnatA (MarC family)
MDTSSFQHDLIGLLAMGNNVSSLGAYLAETQGVTRRRIWPMILTTSLVCFVFLAVFMLFGTAVLNFVGISISSFQIAGGLLLGGVGMEMMSSDTHGPAAHKAVALPAGDNTISIALYCQCRGADRHSPGADDFHQDHGLVHPLHRRRIRCPWRQNAD